MYKDKFPDLMLAWLEQHAPEQAKFWPQLWPLKVNISLHNLAAPYAEGLHFVISYSIDFYQGDQSQSDKAEHLPMGQFQLLKSFQEFLQHMHFYISSPAFEVLVL